MADNFSIPIPGKLRIDAHKSSANFDQENSMEAVRTTGYRVSARLHYLL